MESLKFKIKKILHVINAQKYSVIHVSSQYMKALAKKIKSISSKIIFILDNVVNVKQSSKKPWDVIILPVHVNINFAIYVEPNGQAINIDVINLTHPLMQILMEMLILTVVNVFMD